MHEPFQPYGHIQDITAPTPVPASALRSSIISFDRLSSAAIAHNVVHGMDIFANDQSAIRLRTAYQKPIEAHVIRDWISGHPRIVLPVLVFLLGTLTYTVHALFPRAVRFLANRNAVIDIRPNPGVHGQGQSIRVV
jgi:hypothetical protein